MASGEAAAGGRQGKHEAGEQERKRTKEMGIVCTAVSVGKERRAWGRRSQETVFLHEGSCWGQGKGMMIYQTTDHDSMLKGKYNCFFFFF